MIGRRERSVADYETFCTKGRSVFAAGCGGVCANGGQISVSGGSQSKGYYGGGSAGMECRLHPADRGILQAPGPDKKNEDADSRDGYRWDGAIAYHFGSGLWVNSCANVITDQRTGQAPVLFFAKNRRKKPGADRFSICLPGNDIAKWIEIWYDIIWYNVIWEVFE